MNETKKEIRKQKWASRKQKVADWWERNKFYVFTGLPIIAGVATKGIQAFGKYRTAKVEERNKDLRCWDASLGHYWELNRKLTNDDWVRINNRRDRGESLGSILDELKVLK